MGNKKNNLPVQLLCLIFLSLAVFSFSQNSEAAIRKEFNYQGKLTDSNGLAVADGAYDITFKIYTQAGGESAVFTESWTNATLFTESTTTVTNDGCAAGVDKIAYVTGTNESSLKAGQMLWNSTTKQSAVIESVVTASNYICIYDPATAWTSGNTVTNRIYVKNGLFSVMVGSFTDQTLSFTGSAYYLGITVGTDSEMIPRKKIGSVPQAWNANNLVGDGIIDIDNTAISQDAVNISYNPASGTYDALSVIYGSGGGTGTALSVTQSGTGKIVDFKDGATSALTVIDGGNVGIGTTTPGVKLDIYGALFSANYPVNQYLWDTTSFAQNVGGGLGFGGKYTTGNYAGFAALQGVKENATDGNYAGALRFMTRAAGSGSYTEHVRITSTGDVGIGTTNPGAKLDVNGGAILRNTALIYSIEAGQTDRRLTFNANTADMFLIYNYDEGGTTFHDVQIGGTVTIGTGLIAKGNGNVGIGTSGPLSKLHIIGSGTPIISTSSDSAGDVMIEGATRSFATALNPANLSIVSNSAVATDAGGTLALGGKYSGNSYAEFAMIKAGKNNATSSDYGGYLAFGTRTNGQNIAEAMRINSSGNVGIGTTDIENWSGIGKVIESTDTSIAFGTNTDIHITGNAYYDGTWHYKTTDEATNYYQYQGAHNWRVAPSGTADAAITWINAMSIANSGNVGIGTTNPLAKLTISQDGTGDLIDIKNSGSTAFKITQATVEVIQPLDVQVEGDVGIEYNLSFMNTATSFIDSAGPLTISAGDSNSYENLTLTTSGIGDVVIDIASSTLGFRIVGTETTVFNVDGSGNVVIGGVNSSNADLTVKRNITTQGGNLALNSLSTPSGVTVTPVCSGTCATSWYYRVSAINGNGETLAAATASTSANATSLSSSNYNRISWTAVTGATGYKVYGRATSGSELYIATVNSPALLYNDTGAATPSGALPSANTTGGTITYPSAGGPKRSIILTAVGAETPTTNGAAQTKIDGTNHTYFVLDYDATTDESAYWHWTMPDSYNGGAIDITYYWEAAATSAEVGWCFQAIGVQANNAEDVDSALSSAVCEVDTAQANANDLALITESQATSNFAAGDYVSFKVFRDADQSIVGAGNDDMADDARLVKVKIEYAVNAESD